MSEFLTELNPVAILLTALIVAVIFKSVPILYYPFRLFFTMIHEMGHVFATRLTGGEVVRFSIDRYGNGVATRRGGDDLLVIPAGYLGTALFSAALILLSGFREVARYSLGAVSISGTVDVGNSLAAIKKLVFDDQKITMDELCQALGRNSDHVQFFGVALQSCFLSNVIGGIGFWCGIVLGSLECAILYVWFF